MVKLDAGAPPTSAKTAKVGVADSSRDCASTADMPGTLD